MRSVRGAHTLWLVGLLALPACGGEEPRDPTQYPISREELERNAPSDDPAELSYRRYCIGCHGSDGHGNGGVTGADLASATGPLTTRSDAELFQSVRNGKTGASAVMPAHSPVLSDDQIKAVVGYVRKRFGQPVGVTPDASAMPAQAMPTVAVPAKVAAPDSALKSQRRRRRHED
jgi:cytochrome c553